MNHECETCKHTELNGCDYPCHCCAVVYQNTGFSDMWDQAGCEFCRGEDATYFNDYSVQINKNELIIKCDESYHGSKLKINFCPMCGAKL